MLFTGNPDPLALTLGSAVVPLFCGFTQRDKPPDGARDVYIQYIHFERIYMLSRFEGLL